MKRVRSCRRSVAAARARRRSRRRRRRHRGRRRRRPRRRDVPTTPGARIVTGQAPVVGGNAAGARERALDDALKQAVNQAIGRHRRPADARRAGEDAEGDRGQGAQLRAPLPRRWRRARRTAFTRSGSRPRSTRRAAPQIERGASAAPPPVDAGQDGRARDARRGRRQERGERRLRRPAWSRRSSSAGVRARAADPGETSAAAAAQAAARASLEQAALVTAEVVPEGLVRGTGRVAVSCRANVRLVAAPAGSTIAERAATARVFVEAEKAADGAAQCRDAAGRRPRGPAGGRGCRRRRGRRRRPAICAAVTVDADVVEPAAIPELVKSLRGIGRRIGGRADPRRGRARRDPGPDARRARRGGGRPLARRGQRDHIERRADVGRYDTRARAPARRAPAPAAGGDP